MDGVDPLPHPDIFLSKIDELYQEDKTSLIQIINYCAYLGRCYEAKINPSIEFARYPNPTDYDAVWLEFIKDEGLFLEFTNPIPASKSKVKEKIRYEDILAYAFGEMELRPRDFYTMTMREYSCMTTGYFFKRWRSDEHLRALLYNLRGIFRGKKDSMPSSIEAFYPLPTDSRKLSFMDEGSIKEMWKSIKEYEGVSV